MTTENPATMTVRHWINIEPPLGPIQKLITLAYALPNTSNGRVSNFAFSTAALADNLLEHFQGEFPIDGDEGYGELWYDLMGEVLLTVDWRAIADDLMEAHYAEAAKDGATTQTS